MSEFDFLDRIIEDDDRMFMYCVRVLLSHTFIVYEKEDDKKLYNYIVNKGHENEIRAYLSVIGYNISVDTNMKVVALVQTDKALDTPNVKKLGRKNFPLESKKIIFILWEAYLEKLGTDEETSMLMSELTDKISFYNFIIGPSQLKEALNTLKRFSMIDIVEMEDKEKKIVLYPSLQLCMDMDEFNKVYEEYKSLLLEPSEIDEEAELENEDVSINDEEGAGGDDE